MSSTEQDFLRRVLDLVLEDRVAAADRESLPPYRDPADLEGRLDPAVPEQGLGEAALLDAMRRYLALSIDTSHPRFLNQLWAGFNAPAFAGEILSALRNTSMYTYEVAPAATLIERAMIRMMGRLVGYERPDGTFVTGGSNANLLAMTLARHAAAPDVKRHGWGGAPPLTAFISDQAHYSYEQAANLLGLGMANVHKVATDGDGRMIPERLAQAVAASAGRGERPFFVGATAGTTVLGAFDPLPALADIADAHGLWLHVDGSWGASVVLSRRWRHLVEGSSRTRSFGWTAHKMMSVPLVCSVLLVREPEALAAGVAVAESADAYLFHDGDHDWDLGRKSLQCGRRADALKLWMSWLAHGDRGYEERIDRLFALADHARRRVEEADDLELVAPVQSLSVCFRCVPRAGADDADADTLTLAVRNRLKAEGQALVNYATVRGKTAIRLALANPDVTPADLDGLLERVRASARQLAAPSGAVTAP